MIITINVKFVLTICHKTADSLETVLGQSQVNRARVPGVLDSVNYQPTGLNRPVSSTPNVMFIYDPRASSFSSPELKLTHLDT